jgi:MFS family permease
MRNTIRISDYRHVSATQIVISTGRSGYMNMIYAIIALFWFAQYVYMPFLSPFMAAAGISASLIGMVAGMYGATQMAMRIPLSIIGSKGNSHKRTISMGLIVLIASCLLPLLSHHWALFMLTRAFAGIASSTWVSYISFLLEGAGSESNRRMSFAMAANTGGICVSQLFGQPQDT